MSARYDANCPVARTLEIIGERWTILILRDLLLAGPCKFQDFQQSLSGISPNTLSARLKKLEEHGVIARRFYEDHPPRAEYILTDKGKELGLVIGALATWGSQHVYPEAALVHADCGHPVRVGYYCPHCDDRVRGTSVKLQKKRR